MVPCLGGAISWQMRLWFRITFGLALTLSALRFGTEHPRDENPVGVLDFGGFPTIRDRL